MEHGNKTIGVHEESSTEKNENDNKYILDDEFNLRSTYMISRIFLIS